MVKEFKYYLERKVKKRTPDINLSRATMKESLERLEFAQTLESNPKYMLENAYESMREAADALLYKEGFKSYSHEASISFLKTKNFEEHLLLKFNRFRKIRNGIKYYGKGCEKTDAIAAIELAKIITPKIKSLLGL